MKELKFVTEFKKLWGQTQAKLIYVDFVYKKELNKDFIDYDVVDYDNNRFHLEGEEFLRLTFIGNKGIPFTTLRNPKKIGKYKHLGEQFKLVIKKGE